MADAGPETWTVTTRTKKGTFTLDGSKSTDPDGSIAAWSWTEEKTGKVVATTPTVKLSRALGTYDFRFTVTDDVGAVGTDTTRVVVTR